MEKVVKRSSLYYGQIMVTDFKKHFLFSNKGSYTLEPININREFCAQLT